MFCDKIRLFLYILLIKDSLQQQSHFIGNIFEEKKRCRYNNGSLYQTFTCSRILSICTRLSVDIFQGSFSCTNSASNVPFSTMTSKEDEGNVRFLMSITFHVISGKCLYFSAIFSMTVWEKSVFIICLNPSLYICSLKRLFPHPGNKEKYENWASPWWVNLTSKQWMSKYLHSKRNEPWEQGTHSQNWQQLKCQVFCKTKTCLCNFGPLQPHFYRVKLGFTGVYLIFLISAQKHRLWVLVRTASAKT